MKMTCVVVVSAVILFCTVLPCLGGLDADSSVEYYDADDASYANVVFVDSTVLTNSEEILVSTTSSNTLVMDEIAFQTVCTNNQNLFTEKIMSGVPMVVEGDATTLTDLGITVAVDPESDVSAIYRDPVSGTVYCYGVESDSDNALDLAMVWLDSIKSQSSSADSDVVLSYTKTLDCDGKKAQINGTAVYTELGNSLGKTYYSVRYYAESVCLDSEWSTAHIMVTCDVDAKNAFQGLVSYGPSNTDGQVSQEVGVSISAGGPELSASWSYTISETTIENRCNTGENFFQIYHDTNENNRKPTIVVEPGMIVYVQDGSHYNATDEYNVCYYKPYYEHLWPWDPYYEFEDYTLTADVIIDP